jgi:murein DD-endopeptidase MepM/ murein hydrolase activator NlpD
MKKRKWIILIGIVLTVIVVLAVIGIIIPLKRIPETKEIVISIPEPKILYGLRSDSFHLEESFVGRNENLSNILTDRGVSQKVVDNIARNSLPVFDVHKMKAGNRFTVFYSPDSTRFPHYLVYENNAVEYYVFNLTNDSVKVTAGKKEVISKRRIASGIINSSLWNTIKENNLSPTLALELSEIYAWTIDFFGIQRGDRFRVIYDEDFIGDESIGIGKIYSASFTHEGVEYYAICFMQGDGDSYFDEKGNNLRKSFLKSPLKFSARISSRFSSSRFHPILRISRPHYGVDYAAPAGTPVFTIGEGVVTQKGYQANGGGNYLKIRHNSIYETTYMHLSRFAAGIHPGSRVRQGEMIGFVGSTGLATGPHLDFRVYMAGFPVDPLKIKSPPAEPVRSENFSRFISVRDTVLKELNKPVPSSVIFPINK